MTETLKKELEKLNNLNPIYNNDSVFFKKINNIPNNQNQIFRVIFADYIIKPFEGFDFHTKFNNNIAPPENIMYGEIIQTTEKMYKFKLKTSDGSKHWEGWCPKKSCRLEQYNG